MGWLDRLFGRNKAPEPAAQVEPAPPRAHPGAPGLGSSGGGVPAPGAAPAQLSDEQALQRYRYMLQTAPPEAIEQAHAEAFAKLTPAQRAQALRELAAVLPEHERPSAGLSQDDPRALARLATRAEVRSPGTLERAFGPSGHAGPGMGMGGMLAGTLLASLAGAFVGTMIAEQLFDGMGDLGVPEEADLLASAPEEAPAETEADLQDTGFEEFDSGFGEGDFGGGDFGEF